MSSYLDLVQEFYTAANVKHPKDVCLKLIEEEAAELKEAAEHFLKEFADLNYVVAGAVLSGVSEDDIDASLGRVGAFMSWVIQSFPEEVLGESFVRVHESNMSKLTDGVAVRDEVTGKILKGPNYKAPDLSDLI